MKPMIDAKTPECCEREQCDCTEEEVEAPEEGKRHVKTGATIALRPKRSQVAAFIWK